MQRINTGEYGQTLRVNMGVDVTANTGLNFVLEPKRGYILESTNLNGVTVGLVDIDIGNQTFKAKEYLEYVTKNGDFDYSGQWRMRGEVQMGQSNRLVNDFVKFTVVD